MLSFLGEKMDKVRILHAVACAPDHIHSVVYEAGTEHAVGTLGMPEWLARSLIAERYAEEVKPAVVQEEEKLMDEPAKPSHPVAGHPKRYEKKR